MLYSLTSSILPGCCVLAVVVAMAGHSLAEQGQNPTSTTILKLRSFHSAQINRCHRIARTAVVQGRL